MQLKRSHQKTARRSPEPVSTIGDSRAWQDSLVCPSSSGWCPGSGHGVSPRTTTSPKLTSCQCYGSHFPRDGAQVSIIHFHAHWKPCARDMVWSSFTWMVGRSRSLVGSSRSRKFGRRANTVASSSLLFSPPLSLDTLQGRQVRQGGRKGGREGGREGGTDEWRLSNAVEGGTISNTPPLSSDTLQGR